MKVPSGSVQCDGSVPSLSLTTHKYQQPGTPRHTDTGAATSRHSFYLNTPFSAHDFPAPCPVLPIFAAFRFEPHSKYLGCCRCSTTCAARLCKARPGPGSRCGGGTVPSPRRTGTLVTEDGHCRELKRCYHVYVLIFFILSVDMLQ